MLVPFAVASTVNNSGVGVLASLTLIALYVGTSVPGYIVGLAGVGGAALLLYAGGVLSPLAIALVVRSSPGTDCPSCAADVLGLMWPFILAMLLTPFVIGYWRGSRTRSRPALASASRASAAAPSLDVPPGSTFGGFWLRAAAGAVDAIVLFAVLMAAGVAQDALPHASSIWSVVGLGWLAVSAAYLPVQWAMAGRTPGMRAFGLWVVRADDGGKIGRRIAFLRFMAWILAGCAIGLGFGWIAIDSRKRGWHDLIAGTVVIHRGG
jgi:uncharacterized RDD family membrane protein YckC